MGQKWHLKDIIDLEFFLHHTETGESSDAPLPSLSSNRKIYLDFTKTHHVPFARRDLLKFWVEQQRKTEKHGNGKLPATPGEVFDESYRIVRVILILIALIFGATISWALLSYRGNDPINVFTFLWVMVIPQIFLLSILILSLTFRRLGILKNINGIYPLAFSLIRRIAFKVIHTGKSSLSASQQNLIHDALGLLGQEKTIYRSVLFWPVFNLFQIFGICFNFGALSAAFIRVTITDLAFGWQSTLHVTPEMLHRFIGYVSFPWSWFTPTSYAHPTLTQIEGSKIILKDGMAHLATADLVSWWPFLCFVVFFYGLLPRLLFLIYGIWKAHHAINQIDFTHAACDRLIQRMQIPHMATVSRTFQRQSGTSSMMLPPEPEHQEPLTDSGESLPSTIIFVPEDIDPVFSEDDLADRIQSMFRLRMLGRVCLTMDYAKDKAALKLLMDQTDVSLSATRLVILQEAWQPPIQETISWIRNLRNSVGKKTGIIVALIGKQFHEIKFTSPQNSDLLIWEHAIGSMGDPYIRVENFGG
jgi:hypothetical protein